MKKLLLGALLLLSINIQAQEFMGVKVAGTASSVIAQFKSKGFTLVKQDVSFASLKGVGLNGKDLEVNLVYSPNSKLVWKISVYLPERTSWNTLKNEYQTYLESLTAKYGKPKDSFSFFSSPYEEGDGYEMTAVAVEKCNYAAYFENVTIDIAKFKQVNIAYENSANYEIFKRERELINQNQL